MDEHDEMDAELKKESQITKATRTKEDSIIYYLFVLCCCAALFVGSTAYLGTGTYDMVRTIGTIPYLENTLSVTMVGGMHALSATMNERMLGQRILLDLLNIF